MEKIAHRIGPDLGLLGFGAGAVILGPADRPIAERTGPRIVPPGGGIVGGAVQDLEADVGEKKDLAKDKPEVFKELTAAYKDWDAQLAKPLWGRRGRQP